MDKNIFKKYDEINFLKIFSMFLIIILHILGQGGVLAHSIGRNHYLSLFLQILSLPAVNCFALISGYLNYSEQDKPFDFSKYIKLYLQVLAYTFTITFFAFILAPKLIGFKLLIFSLFPVFTKNYWYFSAYTALFFFMPYLNKVIRKCNEIEAKKIIIVIFFIFSFLSTFASKFDPFTLNKGYSFLWLLFLYIIGSLFKKFSILHKIKTSSYIYVYICSVVFTLINVTVIPEKFFGNVLASYSSPTILLMSIVMLGICFKLKFKTYFIKGINFFSPTTFGIYILHIHTIVWIYFLKDRFTFIAKMSTLSIPFMIIFYGIIIFLFCSIIEKFRIYIFEVFNVNNKAKRISLIISTLLDKISLLID